MLRAGDESRGFEVGGPIGGEEVVFALALVEAHGSADGDSICDWHLRREIGGHSVKGVDF